MSLSHARKPGGSVFAGLGLSVAHVRNEVYSMHMHRLLLSV